MGRSGRLSVPGHSGPAILNRCARRPDNRSGDVPVSFVGPPSHAVRSPRASAWRPVSMTGAPPFARRVAAQPDRTEEYAMRSTMLCVALIMAAAPAGSQTSDNDGPPLSACAAAALKAAPDEWDPASVVTGDLTMDGDADVAFWKRDGETVLVYIVRCDGETPVESWRFGVAQDDDCPPEATVVDVADLLLDPVLVKRVCDSGNVDECEHMLKENERRQALVDGGARELRVRGPACAPVRFRWSKEHSGFMRLTAVAATRDPDA
jgi:hypothetical protein